MRTQSVPHCPVCRQLMRVVAAQQESLSVNQSFECCRCRLAFTGEAVLEALELAEPMVAT